MKTMKIFEPAMCCPTGLCGVGVDPELLRISTVLETLKKKNVVFDRFNLSSAPMEFITDQAINAYISFLIPLLRHTLRMLQLPSAWSNFISESTHDVSCLGQLSGLGEGRL